MARRPASGRHALDFVAPAESRGPTSEAAALPFRRTLVTGGAGFIGRHIVDALLVAGCHVTVIDDLSGGGAAEMPDNVALRLVDIADPDVVATAAAAAPELIVHAAAQVSVARSLVDPLRDRAVNLDGTRHVLDAARLAGTHRFVFLSSGGAIYGETDGAEESTPPRPASYYGVHKLAAEGYVELSGMSYANLRLANVYGQGQRAGLEGGVVAVFAERLRDRLPITINGDGRQTRDLVYVGDVVEAVLSAARSSASGTWNVATGRATSILDLLHEMEGLIAPAVALEHGPARPGDVRTSRLSPRRIAAELGWQARYQLAEGLHLTASTSA